MFRVEKDLKSANVARTIRFTEELFHELHQVALENDVSFNLLVLQCCHYALDQLQLPEQQQETLS